MALNPNKELKLYYSIGEVAEMLGVSETLLRYWEKEFPTITPKKSGRNIRQYSQEDIEQVRLIHHLVKVKGMKLAAARKALRNSKGEVERNMEIVGRLQAVREELMQIKKELDGLVLFLSMVCGRECLSLFGSLLLYRSCSSVCCRWF